MKHLTICFYTGRKEPRFDWFLQSLNRQIHPTNRLLSVVIVDMYADQPGRLGGSICPQGYEVIHTLPKPSIWQGKHRIPKEDWWAIANARNTGLCYAKDGWIAWVDDRSVLVPTWFQAVVDAMTQGYAVCGAYEKRHNLVVEDGLIKDMGTLTGLDPRKRNFHGPLRCPGQWWCGGTAAVPVEWALAVNGVDETCDSLGLEDNLFGVMLQNNQFPICYDQRMEVIEDRTPGPAQESNMPRRTDKGVSPNDKSHALVYKLQHLKRAMHEWDIAKVRETILAGGDFPIPTGPTHDWYDGQPIAEFV